MIIMNMLRKPIIKTVFLNIKRNFLRIKHLKKLVIPSILITSLYYFSNKHILRSSNLAKKVSLQDLNLINFNKELTSSIPEFYIFYEEANELQLEIRDLFVNQLENYLKSTYPELVYKINQISKSKFENDKISQKILKNFGVENLDSLSNRTEPYICFNYGMCFEMINPFQFISKFNSYKVKQKLSNLLFYDLVNDFDELRLKLEFLDNPKNKVVLFALYEDSINEKNKTLLTLLKSKNTKIFLTDSPNLIEKINLEKNCFYVYYPPKLPFTSKNFDKIPISEENLDIKAYLQNNSYGLMLRYGIYRDKFKINDEFLMNEIKNFKDNFFIGFDGFERMQIQKRICYAYRNVNVLANLNKSSIKKNWSIPNKHYLFVWLPNYTYLKEPTFEFLLFGK